jgi:hypothetical protein
MAGAPVAIATPTNSGAAALIILFIADTSSRFACDEAFRLLRTRFTPALWLDVLEVSRHARAPDTRLLARRRAVDDAAEHPKR